MSPKNNSPYNPPLRSSEYNEESAKRAKEPLVGFLLGGCIGMFGGLALAISLVLTPDATGPEIVGSVILIPVFGITLSVVGWAVGCFIRKLN